LGYLGLEPTEGLNKPTGGWNEAAAPSKVVLSAQMTGCSYGATGLPYSLSAKAVSDCVKGIPKA